MITISLVSTCPANGTLILPVVKDGLSGAALPGLSPENVSLLRAAGSAQRFEGDSGSVSDSFFVPDTGSRRILLAGVGKGTVDDFEKLGAAVAARLLTSGETEAVIDLSGLAITPSPEAVARLASGIVLRGWRYDVYRTKLPEKQKPTLQGVSICGAPVGSEAAWEAARGVVEGVAFTRELVTEPANVVFPETFVERCRKLEALGV